MPGEGMILAEEGKWVLLLDTGNIVPPFMETLDVPERVDPPCIGKWALLLDMDSVMPPLMATLDVPDLLVP